MMDESPPREQPTHVLVAPKVLHNLNMRKRFHRWRNTLRVAVEQRSSAFMSDCALRIFLRWTGLIQWIKDNILLWSNLVVLIAAYLNPSLGTHSILVLPYVVAVLFVVLGAMIPLTEIQNGMFRFRTHAVAILFTFGFVPAVMCGLVSALPHLPYSQGLLLAAVMPPPLLSLIIFTLHANGCEPLAMTYSALANAVGLLLMPLLLRAAAPQHAGAFRSFLFHYVVVLLGPLLVGCLLQRISTTRCATSHEQESIPERDNNANFFLHTDLAQHNSSESHWCRHTAMRYLVYVLLLVLNYFVFCSTFMYLKNAVAFQEVVTCTSVVAVFHMVMLCVAWILSGLGFLHMSPEDRIAFVFMCTHKTDTLAVPYVAQLYQGAASPDSTLLGLLIIPVICYYTVQTLVGALLVFSLKRWRLSQHCGHGYAPVSFHFFLEE